MWAHNKGAALAERGRVRWQGDKYSAIVNGNIAQKRREMEQLDKELEKLGL